MITMPIAGEVAARAVESKVLCGIANRELAETICRELGPSHAPEEVSVAQNLLELVDCLTQTQPRVIVLDDELVAGAPLLEFLLQLSESAPVVLIASFDRQKEIARMVAAGQVEFVGRQGDYASLAASLALRHLRSAESLHSPHGSPWTGMSDDVAEIFRHDINNPLTGILGNAELVLSHATKLPAADIQRLQTVVELAVRLRETIRRLSDAWEAEPRAAKNS
jgi:signal transduction histidine kinase